MSQSDPVARREYNRQWREENPGYHPVWHALRRARKLGLEASLTVEDWAEIVAHYGNRCAYCLGGETISIDHVVPLSAGGGTTKDNCVPACSDCNSRKGGHLNGKPRGSKGWVPHIASDFWPHIAEAIYA